MLTPFEGFLAPRGETECEVEMAVGQNLRYLFGDYRPKVVYFKGFWDVHRGTGVLTHHSFPGKGPGAGKHKFFVLRVSLVVYCCEGLRYVGIF